MIRLSVNVLTSAVILLKRMTIYPFSSVSELSQSRASQIDTEDILSFVCDCRWAEIDTNGRPILTTQGYAIVSLNNNYTEYLRLMLADYIINIIPIWGNRIPYGRSEAAIFMTKDEKACFYEANLLKKQPDAEVVSWWDKISDDLRAKDNEHKTVIGRQGEQYSINYERERTSVEPNWVSIDSNLSGYDIRSQIGKSDSRPMLIEVKTSLEKLDNAYFHITSREWLTAQASGSYMFYLWCLYGAKRKLAIISPYLVKPYIPTNNQSGEWESVKIPFSCFRKEFKEIGLKELSYERP